MLIGAPASAGYTDAPRCCPGPCGPLRGGGIEVPSRFQTITGPAVLRGLLWLRLLWPSRFRAHGRAPGIQGLCVRLGPPPAPNPRLSANPGCPDDSGRPGGLNPGSAATHGGAQAFSGLPRGFFAPSTVAFHSGSQAFGGLPWGFCAPSAAAARPPDPTGPQHASLASWLIGFLASLARRELAGAGVASCTLPRGARPRRPVA